MKRRLCYAIVALVFAAMGSFLYAPDARAAGESVRVEKNFDLTEFREGRYADWLTFKSETERWEEETYFNGQTYASTGGLKKGWLYETEVGGASVTLLPEAYGAFTLIGQPLQEVLQNGSPNWNKDYQAFSLIFTDLEDESNRMTFTVAETAYNYATLVVTYGDETYARLESPGACVAVCGPVAAGTADCSPVRFSFDPAQKTFAVGDRVVSAQTYDFSEDFADFRGFGRYRAELRFDQVVFKSYYDGSKFDYEGNGAYKTAKFAVYELCGQILAGETPADTAPPMIGAEFPDSVVGLPLDLSDYARAYDVVSGAVTDISFSVTDPSGNPLSPAEGSVFTPTAIGAHRVTVRATDGAGKTGEATRDWVVTRDMTPPEMSFDGRYAKNYPLGGEVSLLVPEVTDNVDGSLTAAIEVFFGDDPAEVSGGKVKLDKEGEYTVRYTAADAEQNPVTREFRFRAVPVPAAHDAALTASAEAQYLPLLSVPEGWSYVIRMYEKGDAAKTDLLGGNYTYVFDRAGEYVLEYALILEGETESALTVTAAIAVEGESEPLPPEKGGLKGWEIALIAVGSTLGAAAIGAGAWYFIRRKRKNG